MKKWFSLSTSALLLCLLSTLTLALNIEFDQEIKQGALLTGRTDATKIIVFGRTIDVDQKSRFVFGLGRDTEAILSLELLGRDGESIKKQIEVGQREYKTQSISGIEPKYVSPPAELSRRIRADSAEVRAAREHSDDARADYASSFIWPAKGPISGVYGSQRIFNGVPKRPHYGLDIAAPTGTPVIAPAAGKITLAHPDMYYSGGTIVLDHGRGISSTFIHLSKLHIDVGEEVEQGQLIGEIGATGRATGPHLDWRINWFEQRLDPALVLPQQN